MRDESNAEDRPALMGKGPHSGFEKEEESLQRNIVGSDGVLKEEGT